MVTSEKKAGFVGFEQYIIMLPLMPDWDLCSFPYDGRGCCWHSQMYGRFFVLFSFFN